MLSLNFCTLCIRVYNDTILPCGGFIKDEDSYPSNLLLYFLWIVCQGHRHCSKWE